MLPTRSAKVQNSDMTPDWDDVRHFLAVAETGSTLAAGRALRVSQTTAARRVAALEEALGVILFDRRQAGYLLTPAGEALLTHARSAQDALRRLTDEASLLGRSAEGVVRLTLSPIFAFTFMMPIIGDLRIAQPSIHIEIDTTEDVRDLAGGEADIALRVSKERRGAGLVWRLLTADPWTVYCSRAYAERHGVPRHMSELVNHPFIGGGEPGVWAHYQAWLAASGLEEKVIMHHNSSTGLLAAVLVYPERLRHEPRIRAVLDFLIARVPRFTG